MLFAFTSSHRTAGFDLLERLERQADGVTAALRAPSTLITGSVVLATCNRFETYLDLSDEAVQNGAADASELLALVAEAAGVDAAELAESSESLTGDAVASHLFSVSSGLESVVVGEGEIAGQVRRAYTAAAKAGTVTRDLERLFQGASRASRGVKNGTGLQRAGRSMVRLALDLAESRLVDWSTQQVLLVGTGRYAAASLAALRDKGVTDIAVFSRTGRAEAFALKHGVAVVSSGSLTAAIAASDLVITCSVAPTVIVGAQTVLDALAMRGASGFARSTGSAGHAAAGSTQLIIDLGLPRNVDPAVAEIAGVELLDLETISLHAPLEELQATDDAREIVGRAAADFAAKSAEHDVEPALVALRQHVLGVLDAELARNAARDESGEIARALRHLAGVLLHTPSVRARELAHDGDAAAFIDGVAAVFGIQSADVEATDAAGSTAASDDADASGAGALTA